MGLCFVVFPEDSFQIIDSASVWVRSLFGQFYLVLGFCICLYLLSIAFSPLGKMRLGSGKPEYSTLSWLAMMYSTGMGAGIILRAVQEPVFMIQQPGIEISRPEQIHGFEMTFYHWGFTAWAFYGLFALFIAYLLFIKHQNIQLSHLLSKLSNPVVAKGIDLLVILTTVFGVVSAVALGIRQVEGGISFVSDSNLGIVLSVFLCVLIFSLALFSSVKGLSKGIRHLSNINISLTLLLLGYVIFNTDISLILINFYESTLALLQDFIPLSLAMDKFDFSEEFLSDWTYYYWAFWLAWAPFTGIFIARISKGKSIRELILGVLIVPSLGSFLWFTSFGTSAIELINSGLVSSFAFDNVFSATFVLLEQFPLGFYAVILAILLLVGFLITSVDSAIYVLSMFSDLTKINPSPFHKWIWGILLFLVTLGFLIIGKFSAASDVLEAVQKLLIVSSLALALLSILFMIGFTLSLIREHRLGSK
ncbi:glycine betaine transporter [Psychroflexus sediminis]|uniref:Glycine betaine transporter n=2 Tax=Psychroflexus sediminis TaxID=470826 RepID=A0A1G7YZD5_9FLAO|nr:glycine betaine transporter [Psychroflexus sediminis]